MTYKEHQLCGGEIFYLYYYGIHVFLQVGAFPDDAEWVRLVELKFVKNYDEDGCMLHMKKHEYQFLPKPNKLCLINKTGKNSYFSSELKVYPIMLEGKVTLPINIYFDDEIRQRAIDLGLYEDYQIMTGTFFLEKFCGNTNEEYQDLADSVIYYKDDNCHLS